MRKINSIVLDVLERNFVTEINPVNESSSSCKIVGYHFECNSQENLEQVREKLQDIIWRKQLPYSLSEYYPLNRTTKFILYLNN